MNFELQEAPEQDKPNSKPEGKIPAPGPNCGVCPIALLPAGAWDRLTRKPFRKRRPFIFWTLVILCAAFAYFLHASLKSESGQEQLALISINGPIMDSGATLEWIRAISHKPLVKGALLRVDSPGGGAAASQEIYAALAALSAKMPIAVSMGATAASGGLMVSMAGKRIFANPSTITGSIGVRMDIPQLQGLLAKLGIGQETLVTAPFKDAVSYTHAMTPADREYLENVLMNMHEQFVDIVARGRGMSREKAASLANGKIYTGQQAMALGLVDEMGGQQQAHSWLAQQTGVPESRKLLVKKASGQHVFEKLLGLSQLLGLELDNLLQAASPGGSQPVFSF